MFTHDMPHLWATSLTPLMSCFSWNVVSMWKGHVTEYPLLIAHTVRGTACCAQLVYIGKIWIYVIIVLKGEKEWWRNTHKLWSLQLHPPSSIIVPMYESGVRAELTSTSSLLSLTPRALYKIQMGSLTWPSFCPRVSLQVKTSDMDQSSCYFVCNLS